MAAGASLTRHPDMWDRLAQIKPQIEYKFWAGLGHEGQEMPDLIAKLTDLGYEIMEVDQLNQRVLVGQVSQEQWGCTICLREGALVIFDNELELAGHVQGVHKMAWMP